MGFFLTKKVDNQGILPYNISIDSKKLSNNAYYTNGVNNE